VVAGSEVRQGAVAQAASLGGQSAAGALHPAAWLAWLTGATVAIFLTSNPLYLSLGFLAACGVYLSVRDSPKGRALGTFVKIGLVLAALSVPFNVLTGSSGPTVLTTVPEVSFPRSFGGVTLGGAITGEALVTAGGRAVGIATLVVLAAAFNSAVDHFRLVRLAPRSLSQVMLTMTIAILVVPQAVAHARTVAEAQRLRGRRGRGLRALPGLLLPTLHGALERSVQRAESLDARGFGGGGRRGGRLTSVVGVAGLGLCAWGAFDHFYYGASLIATVAMVAGVGLVVATLLQGGGPAPNRLRADRWTRRDVAVAGAAMLGVVLIAVLRFTGAGDADYLAYPEVIAPAFHPFGAVAFLLLLVPVLLHPSVGASSEGTA
jgi:energy-coupling factor transport system permease protein